MAEVGSIKLNLRIRIEAGLGNALTEVGHADTTIDLPVSAVSNPSGMTLNVSTGKMTETTIGILNAAKVAVEKLEARL